MTQQQTQAAIDEARLHEFVGKMLGDLGAAVTAPLIIVGDKLGLYKAIAEAGSVTSEELAGQTGTAERYVREWLAAQAASGYVQYDEQTERFFMTPEQIMVFANEESPVFLTGGFLSIRSLFVDEPKLSEAFKSGDGIGWGDHDACLFCGVEKFFKPTYQASLIDEWIPALGDVEQKLERGAKVSDVGCGHGASTILMAQAYPNSQFIGYDLHEPSIEQARDAARNAGLGNVTFAVATAQDYPGSDFDLVTFFDCLHDMGDPVGAASHVRETLHANGTWMVVEPIAGDSMKENLNPIGRVYYGFSTAVCTPTSLSQDVGLALGAQAGEARLREVIEAGGFTRTRRAAETPFNMVLEARK